MDSLDDLFANFESKKFVQVRNVRLGFGGSEATRARNMAGFAAELASGTYVPADLVELFSIRLWDVLKDVSTEA